MTDAEGRTNKFPTDFVLQALTNQRPEVKLVFPRGDPRVSRLEELQLQAEASDDFGLLKYGVGFGVAGQEPQFIELGQSAPAQAKRQFDYLISLEKLGVDVDQAVTYFAWADDYGPDGQARRTFSDIFFADVRPFEEVFRPDQSGSGESGDQSGGQGGGGNERVRLADLQKQIVVATWNLQRKKPAPGADNSHETTPDYSNRRGLSGVPFPCRHRRACVRRPLRRRDAPFCRPPVLRATMLPTSALSLTRRIKP